MSRHRSVHPAGRATSTRMRVRYIGLSDFAKGKIRISTDELIDERDAVKDLLK